MKSVTTLGKALVFHSFLLIVANGTVSQPVFLGCIPWGTMAQGICSIAWYLMIPIATQFPDMLFISSDLSRDFSPKFQAMGRLEFGTRVIAFWAMILGTLFFQFELHDAPAAGRKGIASYIWLVGLAMFFSALDYAIPSYKRYLRLSELGKWGSKSRVFTKH
jgi:hypothetical protein